MRKAHPWVAAAVLFAAMAGCQAGPHKAVGNPTDLAMALDQRSREDLGIGLNAVSLLLEAQPGSAYPANAPGFQGRRAALQELVTHGFATVRDTGDYVFVERTPKGEAVAGALLK